MQGISLKKSAVDDLLKIFNSIETYYRKNHQGTVSFLFACGVKKLTMHLHDGLTIDEMVGWSQELAVAVANDEQRETLKRYFEDVILPKYDEKIQRTYFNALFVKPEVFGEERFTKLLNPEAIEHMPDQLKPKKESKAPTRPIKFG